MTFPKTEYVGNDKGKMLQWAGHAWCSLNTLLYTVVDENPTEKRPLGKPCL